MENPKANVHKLEMTSITTLPILYATCVQKYLPPSSSTFAGCTSHFLSRLCFTVYNIRVVYSKMQPQRNIRILFAHEKQSAILGTIIGIF